MIKSKHTLLAGIAMTAAEMSKGRYMRAPDGHEGGAVPATPAAAEPAAPAAEAPAAEPAAKEAGDGFFDPNEEVEDSSGEAEPATPEKTDETGEGPKDDGSDGDDPAKKGKSVEERIGEVTATAREAQRREAEARREAEEWRLKAEALAPKKEGEDNVDPNAEPDPLDYEFGEADPQYTRDLATHAARQEFQFQERQSHLKGELASLDSKWEAGIAAPELKEKYPDFDEKVTKGAETAAWACPPLIALGIKDSPVGPDVAYHLASNPEESRRVAKMNGIEQARHFGQLEGRFLRDAELAKTDEPKPVPTPSKAPEPPAARTRGAGGKFAVDADTDDFASFKKMAAPIMNKGVHKGSRD